MLIYANRQTLFYFLYYILTTASETFILDIFFQIILSSDVETGL